MLKKILLIAAAVAFVSSTAFAAPILITSGSTTASQGTAIPSGTTYTPGPTGGGGMDGGAVGFALPGEGLLTVTITDCCLVGDVYEALVDGVSLGITTPVAIGGPTGSTGSFSVYAAGGAHSLDVWDIVLSYLGVASPFGGGTVGAEYSPAGFDYAVYYDSAVPEPATMLTLGTGLLLAARRRRLMGRRS